MNQDKLDTIRLNVLDAGATMVASNREDLIELADYTDSLVATSKADLPNATHIRALCLGVRNSPAGEVLYHERLHLLQWFEAIDVLTAAIAKPAPVE